MAKSKDLFDDSTMSFGEHLEELRVHLWRALIGLSLCVIVTLYFGNEITRAVRAPIDTALKRYNSTDVDVEDNVSGFDFFDYVSSLFGKEAAASPDAPVQPEEQPEPELEVDETRAARRIKVQIPARQLAWELHRAFPELYPKPSAQPALPPKTAAGDPEEKNAQPPAEPVVTVWMMADEFSSFRNAVDQINRPVTLNVQEAFMTYIKVAVVAGLLLASPWMFYQIWLFVAAGLYPHERKYVYTYLPLSVGLFLGGAVFCFLFVFPFVLEFLLAFNKAIGVTPQIRLSEWISFAITLPLMFGISFQLPMVMLFLERISVFEVGDYREKRRISILVISIISCLLTPADPASMLLMMIPLCILYELGIILCGFRPARSPFEAEAA